MSRYLHCADLHICAAEKDYCFSVLDEIVTAAKSREVDGIIFAGDTFNSPDEVKSLSKAFSISIERLNQKCRVLILPGNHESLSQGSSGLERAYFPERVQILSKKPFDFFTIMDTEFLSVPHQKSYPDYFNWPIPPKSQVPRIIIAHGTVDDMVYRGPDETEQEEGGGTFGSDFFRKLSGDYAALGHIHSGRTRLSGSCKLRYPGSPRVWRKGESGEHGVIFLKIEKDPSGFYKIDDRFIELESAGTYREAEVELSPEGDPDDFSDQIKNLSSNDYLCLKLQGRVESMDRVKNLVQKLRMKYTPLVRRLEIDPESVSNIEGIAGNPLVKKFLQEWKKMKPEEDDQEALRIWSASRRAGLESIEKFRNAKND